MPCGGGARPPTLKTLEDWAGAPGIRGQRELRTEIVACLGKNRRLRPNAKRKPSVLFSILCIREMFSCCHCVQNFSWLVFPNLLDLEKRERDGSCWLM